MQSCGAVTVTCCGITMSRLSCPTFEGLLTSDLRARAGAASSLPDLTM